MMNLQDNVALTQPSFAAEGSAGVIVQNKERKKQQDVLAHLSTTLKVLEKEVAGAKSGAEDANHVDESASASKGGGPSSVRFENAMTKMVMALQMLQVQIVKFGQDRSNMDSEIAQAQVNLANDQLQKTIHQVKKIEHEQEHSLLPVSLRKWLKV
jgi:putative cell wall-binding protein